jgi:RND superfamily putative drug exporter
VERLAGWCYDKRWRVLLLWVVALVGISFGGNAFDGGFSSNFSLPGAESQRVFDLLKTRMPQDSGFSARIVVKADGGLEDPAVQSELQAVLAKAKGLEGVTGVISPYEPAGKFGIAPGGHIGYGTVQFTNNMSDVPKSTLTSLMDEAEDLNRPGLQAEVGDPIIQNAEQAPPGAAEIVGLLAAILILIITFGSLLAMGLPVITAIFGIGIGLALIKLLGNVLDVPIFAPQMAAMIGIGVGIDYALFIVTRYRQALHGGKDPRESTIEAITTSGRAVLFAGLTVVISLLGILLMGFAFVQGLAVGAASAVLVTMLASVTLVPALLGFVGHKIDSLRVPFFHRHETAHRDSFWFRWSRLIAKKPALPAIVSLGVLVALALPLFSLRLGSADAGNNPKSLTTRRAYDLLADGFGPGSNGVLLIAADIPDRAAAADLQKLSAALAAVPNVRVNPPVLNPQGDTALITVVPPEKPQAKSTDRLVHHLRNDVIPSTLAGSSLRAYVGGTTAFFTDFSSRIGERLPLLIGVVIGLSFLLLMIVFRSLLVPLKAAVMNLLSIGAAYGVIVAIFQWGWAGGLFGVEPGPIEAWVPMMLFAILFGLSMDYEVFLLSRVREEYLRSGDNGLAVADGLATTARVITAAAAIMVTVFLAFVLGGGVRQIKLFGLGLAVAILIDATIVRLVLVPSTMELLGDANWWLPKWLDRLLPHVDVERTDLTHIDLTDEPEPATVPALD